MPIADLLISLREKLLDIVSGSEGDRALNQVRSIGLQEILGGAIALLNSFYLIFRTAWNSAGCREHVARFLFGINLTTGT